MATIERPVLRYRRNQRIVHAVLAASFLLLLVTGMMLLWGPASRFAGGGTSRLVHRIAAVGYMAVPFGYLLADRKGAIELVKDSFRYDRDDLAWFKHMYRYAMGNTREMPPQGRLNAGQKLHHAFVIVVSVGVVGTGLTLWFLKGSLGPNWSKDIPLAPNHHFVIEYFFYMPSPAEEGKDQYLLWWDHEEAIATENGIEYLSPPQTELYLIR